MLTKERIEEEGRNKEEIDEERKTLTRCLMIQVAYFWK